MADVLTGCEGIDYRTQRKDKAKELLEAKYHEEFEVELYEGQQILQKYYTVTAYSREYPDLLFEAGIPAEGDVFSDGYAAKRIALTISDRISQNLDGVQGLYLVYSELMVDQLTEASPDMSIEEFAGQNPSNKVTVNIFLAPEEIGASELYQKISKSLEGVSGISGILRLYIIDEEQLGKIEEYTSTHVKLYGDFKELTEGKMVFSADYSDSVINMTEDEFVSSVGEYL